MKQFFFWYFFVDMLIITNLSSCKNGNDLIDFDHAGGYVIGKEICNLDTSKDFWLIDLSYEYNPSGYNYGVSITINGIFYKHMIKTKQLLPELKVIGKKVSFDFHLSSTKVISSGCIIANPTTYNLKEMQVISSFEIR